MHNSRLNQRRSDGVSLAIVLGHFALTFLPVYVSLFTGFPGAIVCYLVFGFLANGLVNLLHELAHFHVFSKRLANQLFGQFILGPLFLSDFESYRDRHWKHHLYLGSEQDTKDSYLKNIRGWDCIPYLLECLLLIPALQLLAKQKPVSNQSKLKSKPIGIVLLRLGVPHFFLILSLIVICRLMNQAIFPNVIIAYVFVYIYGVGSLTIFAATFRAVAEHQLVEKDEMRMGRAALRTMRCNWLTRLIFGAYGFEFHATHHISPSIPYYHLREQTLIFYKTYPQLAKKVGYLDIVLNPSELPEEKLTLSPSAEPQ